MKIQFLRGHLRTLAALYPVLLPFAALADDGGIASISQVGDTNRATIEQKYVASGALTGAQNSAIVSQSGINNQTDITQEGNSLTATVTQNGADNTSHITQYGSGHNADVQQIGTGWAITITQDNMRGAAASTPPSTVTVRQQ